MAKDQGENWKEIFYLTTLNTFLFTYSKYHSDSEKKPAAATI